MIFRHRSVVMIGLLTAILCTATDLDARSYARIALAERHPLPYTELFPCYARVADPGLRLTYVRCLGENGDRAATPDLTALLADGKGRIRLLAAISLAALRDPVSLPALCEMAEHDPHHYGREQAKLTLSQFQGKDVPQP